LIKKRKYILISIPIHTIKIGYLKKVSFVDDKKMSFPKKINIKGGQKSQLALSDMKQKAKMMAYLRGGNPRVHSETVSKISYFHYLKTHSERIQFV